MSAVVVALASPAGALLHQGGGGSSQPAVIEHGMPGGRRPVLRVRRGGGRQPFFTKDVWICTQAVAAIEPIDCNCVAQRSGGGTIAELVAAVVR